MNSGIIQSNGHSQEYQTTQTNLPQKIKQLEISSVAPSREYSQYHITASSTQAFRQSRQLADGSEYIGLVNIVNGNEVYTDNDAIIKDPKNRQYRGGVVNGVKHGTGILTFLDPKTTFAAFEGIYEQGKAIQGSYYYRSGNILKCTLIKDGLPLKGSESILTCNSGPLKTIVGKFSGKANSPIEGECHGAIEIDNCLCNFTGIINNNQLSEGEVFAPDGYLVYKGKFIQNRPMLQGINVKNYDYKFAYAKNNKTYELYSPRELARELNFVYTDNNLVSQEVPLSTLQVLSPTNFQYKAIYFIDNLNPRTASECLALRMGNYGVEAIAKRKILKGEILGEYTGAVTKAIPIHEVNKDKYAVGDLKQCDAYYFSAKEYGNNLRFIQCLPSIKYLSNLKEVMRTSKEQLQCLLNQAATANLEMTTIIHTGISRVIISAKRNIEAGEILGYDYISNFRNMNLALFNRKGDVLGELFINNLKLPESIKLNNNYDFTQTSKQPSTTAADEISIFPMHQFIFDMEIKYIVCLGEVLNRVSSNMINEIEITPHQAQIIQNALLNVYHQSMANNYNHRRIYHELSHQFEYLLALHQEAITKTVELIKKVKNVYESKVKDELKKTYKLSNYVISQLW